MTVLNSIHKKVAGNCGFFYLLIRRKPGGAV